MLLTEIAKWSANILQHPGMQWGVLSLAFFLTALGLPLSTFALFALLVNLIYSRHVPWYQAALLAAVATSLGHLSAYYLFSLLGPNTLGKIKKAWPKGAKLIDEAINLIKRYQEPPNTSECKNQRNSSRSWNILLVLLVLRWVGGGYSQVFWILGMFRTKTQKVIYPLILNNFAWAAVWTYLFTFVSWKIPFIVDYLVKLAVVVLLLTGAFFLYSLLAK